MNCIASTARIYAGQSICESVDISNAYISRMRKVSNLYDRCLGIAFPLCVYAIHVSATKLVSDAQLRSQLMSHYSGSPPWWPLEVARRETQDRDPLLRLW